MNAVAADSEAEDSNCVRKLESDDSRLKKRQISCIIDHHVDTGSA